MTLDQKSLAIAAAVGTALQVAMVVAGHRNAGVARLFAVGGMGISLFAGRPHAGTSLGAVGIPWRRRQRNGMID